MLGCAVPQPRINEPISYGASETRCGVWPKTLARFRSKYALHWLHTLVVMNQSALYVPTEHVWNVYQAIQKARFSDEEKAFLYFVLARAQKTPLKGIIETPPKKYSKSVFKIIRHRSHLAYSCTRTRQSYTSLDV